MLHITSSTILSPTPRRPWRGRPSIAFVVMCAVASVGASAAQAKTKHPYSSVIKSAVVSSGHGYPAPGGTATIAGTWKTNDYGDGAVIDHLTVTGHPAATTFTVRGTEAAFLPHGTFKDTFTGDVVVLADGDELILISGRITGGTAAYRGAKGSFVFRGSINSGTTITNGQSAGTAWY